MHTQPNKRKTFWNVSLLVLAAMLLAACQPASEPGDSATEMPTMAPASTATASIPETGSDAMEEAVVTTATDPVLGEILVDGKGMTLYMFKNDGPNQSNCAGDCLNAWPPLISNGSPEAGPGVDETLLDTAELDDGRLIVTYNQMPLYFWAADQKPGDTTGQNVNEVWFVVNPDGQVVETDTSGKPKGAIEVATSVPTPMNEEDDYARGESSSNDVKLAVAEDPTLGPILVDGKGMTLYIFTKDEPGISNCAGDCLNAWPPLIDVGDVNAEDGVDPALIGSAKLADGRMIVTYNQRPLYYWAADVKPGHKTGQGVNQVWYVISPDGEPVGQ